MQQSRSIAPRPGPSHSSSSAPRQHPYASTSSSRPSRSNQPNGNYPSPRSIIREKWARTFGCPHYLEPGVNNRLVLSLRSGIPAEIDFALDRLVQVSGVDPDILRFAELPGLLEGLLALVQLLLDERSLERVHRWDDILPVWSGEARETTRRRACEAALILRNLSIEKERSKSLHTSKRLARVITDALEEGAREDGDDLSELRVYLLETLEVIAEHLPLVLPGHSISANNLDTGEMAIAEDPSSPSVRLFPILVALTRSPDRALVVAAFRTLTVLSLNDTSDAALSLVAYNNSTPQPPRHPHPIQTAVELLPVADAELGSVVLDFIYQHTLVPANAVLFAARPDLLAALRLVCAKLHLGARRETVEVTLPMAGTEADTWYKKETSRHRRKTPINVSRESTTKLDSEELQRIVALQEPERTLTWMRTVFESLPNGDITQVALWQAYRAEFEPLGPKLMLPAADVIKMTTDAFPQAMPMVIENPPPKKFIIRGMRIGDRADLRTVYICRWTGCQAPLGPASPATLYWHLHHKHLSPQPPVPQTVPLKCHWSYCPYTSSHSDPTLALNDLTLHVRTHIPVYQLATTKPPVVPTDSNNMLLDPPTVIHHQRYHAQLDDDGEVTGLGFLACLVLRNVARTVRTALGNPAGGASVVALSGGEGSIFEAMQAAAEGSEKKDGVFAKLEKVDYSEASVGATALVGLEQKLLMTTVEDHGLGKMLGEVLAIVADCRQFASTASALKDLQQVEQEV